MPRHDSHEIGRRFQVTPENLPSPKTEPIVTNRPLRVPYNGQAPQVPAGFIATAFAKGLANPRRLLVLPNGDVLVAEQSAGCLILLRGDGDGPARWINRHVEDLNKPYGLAWQDGYVLVADQDGIWRVPHVLGVLRAGRPAEQQRTSGSPQADSRRVRRGNDHRKITPDLLFEAHSSVLDLAFYTADQFPPEYKGSAFVALKGSWNRSEPTSYKVVRVPFRNGRPEGYYENFATGFWVSGERSAEVWGRPAALAVAKDGSLLVADDTGGNVLADRLHWLGLDRKHGLTLSGSRLP